MGLALSRADEVVASLSHIGPQIEVVGCGADTVSRGPDNLIYRTAVHGFALLGVDAPELKLLCRNEIPHGGGQGSSAAAIVSGLAVARALTPGGAERMSDRQLLDAAALIEGHPDNAAPAVLGGFTLAWTGAAGQTEVVRNEVHPAVRLVLFSAQRGSSTEHARAVLPGQIPHADAAANSAAAALLVHALTTAPEYLLDATEDRLHQRYRAPVMPATAALITRLRQAGIAAVMSGAGPSVLAFVTEDLDLDRWATPEFEAVPVEVDLTGLRVEQL